MSTASPAPVDLVGERVLIGVQMVNISRLSTDPVPLTGRGLVTVAGQGPKDSNGAGKSSFIAGIAFLSCDIQWRFGSGAQGVSELLFTAELAAQEANYANADYGYILGVFADPAVETLADLQSTALSVWVRINRKAPHIQLRWLDGGLHLPQARGDAERERQADLLWSQLPPSNGRSDFTASRMPQILYGDHVRCVSFLSTSVRASTTPNLLAQPLNELNPARIFDAIATLTGLDRELAQEQTKRAAEDAERRKAREAADELEQWETEVAGLLRGITQREAARDHLGLAQGTWATRCARHYLDGLEAREAISADRARLEADSAEQQAAIDALDTEISTLKDDKAFDQRHAQLESAFRTLSAVDRELEKNQARNAALAEQHSGQHRTLADSARGADGRTIAQAHQELEAAKDAEEQAVIDHAEAVKDNTAAINALTAAETGQDLFAQETAALGKAGVAANALLDLIQLDPAQRDRWEPRLAPYLGAIVIAHGQTELALAALADHPGTLLIEADPPNTAGPADLPRTTDPDLPLITFTRALAQRAGSLETEIDPAAGLHALGGHPEPLTGRAGRIAAARARCTQAAAVLKHAVSALELARTARKRAETRRQAAQDAETADNLMEEITRLRRAIETDADEREKNEPLLARSRAEFEASLGLAQSRQDKLRTLNRTRTAHTAKIDGNRGSTVELTVKLSALDLDGRARAWGGTAQAAQAHILALDEDHQYRRVGDWNETACQHLNNAVRASFPESGRDEEMPGELRALIIEGRWRTTALEGRVRLAPDLLRALHTHLTGHERHDQEQRTQITAQRTARTADLQAALQGAEEAARTNEAHRGSLARGIKQKLRQVADEFDRLDQRYGGYGATLEFPEPEPPADPTKLWQWSATPMWRRAEGQRHARYNLKANTAQLDEKAAKLVCAAALAGARNRPLLLVLDELGRNLGSQHRREAVALFERIGQDRNITVIGALQDDMERYAQEASGLYIKLRRSSDTQAYNEPPVIVGDEANRSRVRLLRDWLAGQRPSSHDTDEAGQ
jgi:chromosome segregation protein